MKLLERRERPSTRTKGWGPYGDTPPTGGSDAEWSHGNEPEATCTDCTMMPDRFTEQVRQVVVQASLQNAGLLHPYLNPGTTVWSIIAEPVEPIDNAQMISEIRSSLSLQVREVAEIVGVERPTIYSWIRGEVMPQRPNQARLGQLHGYARQWRSYSSRPIGRVVRQSGADGKSLLDLLKAEDQGEAYIVAKFRAIAKHQKESDLARKPSVREKAEELGFPALPEDEGQREIDFLTGKRFGLD